MYSIGGVCSAFQAVNSDYYATRGVKTGTPGCITLLVPTASTVLPALPLPVLLALLLVAKQALLVAKWRSWWAGVHHAACANLIYAYANTTASYASKTQHRRASPQVSSSWV